MATPVVTGTVYPDRERGTWYYVINIPAELSPDGKRHQPRKRGFALKGDAKEAMAAHLRTIHVGSVGLSGKMTLREFWGIWQAENKTALEAHAFHNFVGVMNRWVLPWLGDTKLTSFARLLPNHYDMLLSQGGHKACAECDLATCKKGKPLSLGSIQLTHFVLRKVLNLAVEKDLFGLHPMNKVKTPSAKGKRVAMASWTAEEAAFALTAFGDDKRFGAAWTLALTHGLRRGEIAGLKWSDIDFENKLLHIRRQRTARGGAIVEVPPKAGSARTIPLSEIAIPVLELHRARQVAQSLRNGYRTDYVFVRSDGTVYSLEAFNAAFRTLLAKTSLPSIRLHDLRHTFATMLMVSDVQPVIAAALCGHSDPAMTMRVYQHNQTTMGRKAMDSLTETLLGA